MSRFIPDPNFEKALEDLVMPQAAEAVASIAEDYVQRTVVIRRPINAPWMPRRGHGVIEVRGTGSDAYVTNTDHGAAIYEWGGRYTPARAPLRRAVTSAGFKLRED